MSYGYVPGAGRRERSSSFRVDPFFDPVEYGRWEAENGRLGRTGSFSSRSPYDTPGTSSFGGSSYSGSGYSSSHRSPSLSGIELRHIVSPAHHRDESRSSRRSHRASSRSSYRSPSRTRETHRYGISSPRHLPPPRSDSLSHSRYRSPPRRRRSPAGSPRFAPWDQGRRSSPDYQPESRDSAPPCQSRGRDPGQPGEAPPYYVFIHNNVRYDIENPSSFWPIPSHRFGRITDAIKDTGSSGGGYFTVDIDGHTYNITKHIGTVNADDYRGGVPGAGKTGSLHYEDYEDRSGSGRKDDRRGRARDRY